MKKLFVAFLVLGTLAACGKFKKSTEAIKVPDGQKWLPHDVFKTLCLNESAGNPNEKGFISLNGEYCLRSMNKELVDGQANGRVLIDDMFLEGEFIVTTGLSEGAVYLAINGQQIDVEIPDRKLITGKDGQLSYYIRSQRFHGVNTIVWTCFDRNMNRVWCSDKDGVIPH